MTRFWMQSCHERSFQPDNEFKAMIFIFELILLHRMEDGIACFPVLLLKCCTVLLVFWYCLQDFSGAGSSKADGLNRAAKDVVILEDMHAIENEIPTKKYSSWLDKAIVYHTTK